jgi:hypothetical protein
VGTDYSEFGLQQFGCMIRDSLLPVWKQEEKMAEGAIILANVDAIK